MLRLRSASTLSSSAIVLKLLQEGAEIESPHGQTTLGILIYQDIIIVPMILLTPLLAMRGIKETHRDEIGKIIDHFVLESKVGNVAVEIPPRTWHSFIALQEGSVLYEIKEGPFIQETGKTSASWAPEERTREAIEFNQRILGELNLETKSAGLATIKPDT
jgi:hypothetical protein